MASGKTNTTKRIGGNVIRAVLGAILALFIAEAGLRLALNECEANGNYWGRGAFVGDVELGYRHAPGTTAYVGRYGSFGPHAITFNSGGYRDGREPPTTPAGGGRILVSGASLVVGLGLEDDEDLFHVKLEEYLSKSRWRDSVEVYSVAQTGYWTDQVCALTERELDRYAPDLVVMSIPGRVAVDTKGVRRDTPVVNGYRLSRDRVLPVWPVDELRTRSYVYMRVARSKLVRSVWEALGGRDDRSSEADPSAVPECLASLKARLDADGTPLLVMLVGDPGSAETDALEDALLADGFDLIRVPLGPPWSYGDDGHWNSNGHENAAGLVAAHLAKRSDSSGEEEGPAG